MNRVARVVVAALFVGALAVLAVFLGAMMLARAGQSTVEDLAPGSPIPPKEAFYDRTLFGDVAPWAFLVGAGGVLLAAISPASDRRR